MQVLTDTDTTRKTVRLRLPGVVVAALFVLLTLASAYVSLMMWGLGVGVQQSTHYTVGIVFAAIHAACFGGGVWSLLVQRRLLAVGFPIAATPLCVGALAVAIYLLLV